ncbi:MAG: hypothetical protein ACREJC_10945 [Tepidisphaeraceae bacterium]
MLITDSRWLIYPPEPLAQTIRGALLNALAFTSGNQAEAGRLLGLSPRIMTYQMRLHDIPTALPPRANRPRYPRQKES